MTAGKMTGNREKVAEFRSLAFFFGDGSLV
jgi:hypothetical protein